MVNSMSDVLLGLQRWYESQCNGDWEHQYGISIETQDNPGWRVEIDLKDTPFAGIPFPRVEERDGNRWLLCWIEKDKFIGAGDPTKLSEIIQRFLVWTGSR
jgi:hypothetical protein